MRLDRFIFLKFGLPSRSYAENLIKTGAVRVNGNTVAKSGAEVCDSDDITIVDDGYSSQGAYKLEEAFKVFDLSAEGKLAADIGCSNGGFTDFLLRRGAEEVTAVDVGECVLPQRLLDGGKVRFIRANARELPLDAELFDFVCADLSFISLTYVLGELFRVLKSGGEAVVLVKPQFELDKAALNKKGIVTDPNLRRLALDKVKARALECGFTAVNETQSPARFENKNIEFLLYLKKA